MLKIWGRNNSINVQKVMWTVAELGLSHQRIDAGGAFGMVNEPNYLAMNPNARVPVINDEGLIVWESNAIVRYLCAKHSDGELWPSDPADRTRADRWMDWQAASMVGDMTAIFWGMIRTPEAERNMDVIGAAVDRMNGATAILDQHLGDNEWVAGDRMTMGDLAVGAMVYRWLHLPIERAERPNVSAYHDRLAARPAFAEHVMIPLS
jgi:glutathione S-transferase